LHAARGVAIREFALNPGHGSADYLLYVDGKACGVVEAKKQGATLTGVEIQSARYAQGLPASLPAWQRPLPFLYESNGIETHFTQGLDPSPRARNVFSFHRPEMLAEWLKLLPLLSPGAGGGEGVLAAQEPSARYLPPQTFLERMQNMPELKDQLWPPKPRAIANIEQSLRENRPRALVQMATGSGKTLLAIVLAYRLIKFAGARRILFLVDRANLGRQAKREFDAYVSPYNNYKFGEEYIVQHLQGNVLDTSARMVNLAAWLTAEGITVPDGRGHYITNFGAIAAARKLDDFPSLDRKRIRVIRYRGTNKVETIDEQLGQRGYAVGFEGLIGHLKRVLPHSEVIQQSLRTEVNVFPEIALRELIANALIHQDFSVTGAGPMVESYGDYVEQLTYLLFLKMAHERSRPPYSQAHDREGRDRARRFLGHDEQQAAQLRAAHQDAAQGERPRRGGVARQRAVRRRRRRNHSQEAPARMRAAHPAAPAHGAVLRSGSEGERAVLRQEAGQRNAVDQEALDLRPAHQPALHAQDQSAEARRPGRVRRPLQRSESPSAQGHVER
jgi:hypothetical protein